MISRQERDLSRETSCNPSADDNVVLEAIKKYAIGYFGFAYYIENQESISSVNVWNDYESSEEKYVTPSFETVADYPMARPIFVYTDDLGSKKSTVAKYLQYVFLTHDKNSSRSRLCSS